MKIFTLATTLLVAAALSAADAPKSVYEVPLKDIDGKETSLKIIDKKVFPLFDLFPKEWEQKFIFYRISDHSPIQATFEFKN